MCVVLDGSMTSYTDNSTSTDEEMILEGIKKGMETGAFVESPIVRVTYIDHDNIPSGGKGTDTTNTPISGRFAYGIVAVVATLFLLSLVVLWRRQHKNESTSTLSPDITSEVDTTAPENMT